MPTCVFAFALKTHSEQKGMELAGDTCELGKLGNDERRNVGGWRRRREPSRGVS